jgi:ABC-type multidrug transport system fused ATPase/permease subunit
VNRWLSARFNLLSSVVVGITAVTVLLAPGVTAAMAGFALAFANTISHNLLFVVRRFVQLEQSMVALERIKEYSELPLEAPELVEPRPPVSWPENGDISVENLVIRYAVSLLEGVWLTPSLTFRTCSTRSRSKWRPGRRLVLSVRQGAESRRSR